MYGWTMRDQVGFIAIVLVVGALVGVGCERAVGYVWQRIHIDWRPVK